MQIKNNMTNPLMIFDTIVKGQVTQFFPDSDERSAEIESNKQLQAMIKSGSIELIDYTAPAAKKKASETK